jgi:glycerophosphoryl diester phosphodiesterase
MEAECVMIDWLVEGLPANPQSRKKDNICFLGRFNKEVDNINSWYTAKLQELYHEIFSSCKTGTITLLDALEEISSDPEKSQQVILKLRSLIAFSMKWTNNFGTRIKEIAICNPLESNATMAHLMCQKFFTDKSTLESYIQKLSQDLQLKTLSVGAASQLRKTIMLKMKHWNKDEEKRSPLSPFSPSSDFESLFDLELSTCSLGHELFLMKTIVKKINNDVKNCLVAHRGFHCTKDQERIRPLENTLAAYEQAWAMGMKHAECDVVLTKDNRLMLCHDDTFRRLAMFPSRRTFVDTHPNNLKAKEVLTKCVTRSGAGVPFLTHVLDIAAAIGTHKKLVIELKPGISGTADRLIEILIANHSYLENISVIMSFQLSVISRLAKLFRKTFPAVTDIKLLYLLVKPEEAGMYGEPYNHFPIENSEHLENVIGELDGFYVGYSEKLLSTHRDIFSSICRRYVIGVYDMEPDSVVRARELTEMGVVYVNTDMPRSLLHGEKRTL